MTGKKKLKKPKKIKVVFQPKSDWQRPNCIRFACRRNSTLEAVLILNQGRYIARIRCCDNLACKRHAAKMAREGAKEPLAR